ncbi:MAG: gamma-glutamyltransferase family protein [Candidatus Eremiobacteraeota bacterium]|nr:gamma-glutamyltransferase family protein [Candidatus Eremiobacteraeota bacterium]
MTSDAYPGRPAALSSRSMVTAPHALAAQAGVTTLTNGGNAADAAIAIAASLTALYPHMTGIGGDAFFLYYDAASDAIHAYNGSGAAAHEATLDFYAARKDSHIPERSGAAVLTVPGAVDAWYALHERFGTLTMESILAPAIGYAQAGAPAARSFVAAIHRLRDMLSQDDAARVLLVEHGPRRTGDRFANPALAQTLREIAKGGRRYWYEGEAAAAIDRCCRSVGSPLRARDLAAHRGLFTQPCRGHFFGCASLTMPPNSQGIAALVAQQTYEAYCEQHGDLQLADGSAQRVHAQSEAIGYAYADRDACVGDPRDASPWAPLLDGAHTRVLAQAIDPNALAQEPVAHVDAGDTAYFACVDSGGNAVSFIQSLFHSFGAGVVVPELGIALQNRGTAFELTAGTLRSLVPGRRPFHTLMPCMLLRDGRPWLVYGSMGGEGQPQTALQLTTRILVDGHDPQTAIEAPRWRFTRDATAEPAQLHLEARFSQACRAGLRARGHELHVLGDFDESMGHAGAICIDRERGVLVGGADPRGDGAALGL